MNRLESQPAAQPNEDAKNKYPLSAPPPRKRKNDNDVLNMPNDEFERLFDGLGADKNPPKENLPKPFQEKGGFGAKAMTMAETRNQIAKIKREAGIEDEKGEDGFEALVAALKSGFEKGLSACKVITKIPQGSELAGKKNNGGSEQYDNFFIHSQKAGPKVKNFLPDESDVAGTVAKTNEFNNLADAAAFLCRHSVWEKTTRRVTREVPWGLIFTKNVTEDIEGHISKPARFSDLGVQGEDGKKEVSVLCLPYIMDKSVFKSEGRDNNKTSVNILVDRDLGEKLLAQIKKDPEKIWEIIDAIDGSILKTCPPQKKNEFGKSGLLLPEVNERGDPLAGKKPAILPWKNEKRA